MDTKTKPANTSFNKYAYAAFVIVAIIFLAMKDYSQSTIFMGLALVFDPFDQTVKFNQRPVWQRVWLIVHLLVSLGLFGWMIAQDIVK
ncbi:hypothetical protein BH11BAC3_BH11BAC3_06960 [soil metagenome]